MFFYTTLTSFNFTKTKDKYKSRVQCLTYCITTQRKITSNLDFDIFILLVIIISIK